MGAKPPDPLTCHQYPHIGLRYRARYGSRPPPHTASVPAPECVRPFPSVKPRKTNRKRSGKIRILTDTPVKNKICYHKWNEENDGH